MLAFQFAYVLYSGICGILGILCGGLLCYVFDIFVHIAAIQGDSTQSVSLGYANDTQAGHEPRIALPAYGVFLGARNRMIKNQR